MDLLQNNTFILNKYLVNKKRIGKGSFSQIYKCKNIETNKTYALKEILIEKNKNKKQIKREFDIMRRLNHKNIVKIHDVIIDTNLNNIYFIMDYYKLGDLSQFLNHKPLKEKFTRKYIKQLANGLEYLLNNNILHRDLKPQNILLSDNYIIKITDFGFATYYKDNSIINTLCGSPMYMAPEIINKNGYNIKSDLWSVGIILYEMLHGYTPFKVDNFIDLILEIKKNKININVDISIECQTLILILCKSDPNERISWGDFFNHNWFKNDEIITDENNLMNIDFNSSLPIFNSNNESQFCSFIHKSIIENNDDNIEFNFLNNSDSDDYLSADNSINSIDLNNSNISLEFEGAIKIHSSLCNDLIKDRSTPIIIPNNNNLLKYKNNSFIIVNPNEVISKSLPIKKKTLTDSLRQYLYSSMKIIKDSYNYINTNSI